MDFIKKLFQCYVCGLQYKTVEDMGDHIKLSHEEGREYLVCPKCEFPVRDLKRHYTFKHPGWSIPAGEQHKATVWSDFTHGKKKVRPAVKFRDGTFVSTKQNGKELHYRSGYECEVYELLEQISEVIQFDAEPFEIPYLHEGKQRKYRPDLSILFADGRKEIWEIKPATQTSLPVNESKWTAANEFCLRKGWEFQVITEVGINRLRSASRRLKDNPS